MKNLSLKEKYAIYVAGYGPNCGYALKEWLEIQAYFRHNPTAVFEVKKSVASMFGGQDEQKGK